MAEKIGTFVKDNWAMLAACITFIGGLWYQGKLNEMKNADIEARLVLAERSTKETNERLRSIELALIELKTILKMQGQGQGQSLRAFDAQSQSQNPQGQ